MNSTKKAKEIIQHEVATLEPRFDITRQDKTTRTYFSPKERHTSKIAIGDREGTHKSSKIDNDNHVNMEEPGTISQHVLICIGLNLNGTVEDWIMVDLQRTVEEQAGTRANHHCKKNKKERASTRRWGNATCITHITSPTPFASISLTAKYHLETSLLLVSITRPTPFTSRRKQKKENRPGGSSSSQTIISMTTKRRRRNCTAGYQQQAIFIAQLRCTYARLMEEKRTPKGQPCEPLQSQDFSKKSDVTRPSRRNSTYPEQPQYKIKHIQENIPQQQYNPWRHIEFSNNQNDSSNKQPNKQLGDMWRITYKITVSKDYSWKRTRTEKNYKSHWSKTNTKVTDGQTGPDKLRHKIETRFLNIATRNLVAAAVAARTQKNR